MSATISDIIARRSIRAYKDDKVPRDVLEMIIKAGRYAPSAANSQLWHFTVVENIETINNITAALKSASTHPSAPAPLAAKVNKPEYTVNFGAPVFIIISGDPVRATTINDCSVAAGNIMLAAHSIGLGSCWINQPAAACDVPEFRSLLTKLGVPESHKIYACICLGYPKDPLPQAPARKEGTVNFVDGVIK
jgi:nitroreductase